MAAGDKPKIKVSIKPMTTGAKDVPLFAAWDKGGRLSASLDRKIVELAVKLDDGSIVRVKRKEDGWPDHYINIYDNSQTSPAPRAAKVQAQSDDDTSDLPF
jgi:hypothetical protein